jgi:hypothetical protein
MAEFPSWRSYYDFARAVRRGQRYFRTPAVEEFLQAVLETSAGRERDIPAGYHFFARNSGTTGALKK